MPRTILGICCLFAKSGNPVYWGLLLRENAEMVEMHDRGDNSWGVALGTTKVTGCQL